MRRNPRRAKERRKGGGGHRVERVLVFLPVTLQLLRRAAARQKVPMSTNVGGSGQQPNLTTHVHAEYADDERSHADAHGQDGDFQVERQERVPVRVEDELDDLLRGLNVRLRGPASAMRSQ